MAAGLKNIKNTGESNAVLWVAMGRLLRPVFTLVGGKHKLWPPSRQSAPLLIDSFPASSLRDGHEVGRARIMPHEHWHR